MFHDIKGTNITLDRNLRTAHWTPRRTGGCAFPARPLCEVQPITLKLDGTGGIELGITTVDPVTYDGGQGLAVPTSERAGYQFLNDVKIHKRTCTMTIAINSKKQEVTSTYGGGHYVQHVQRDVSYWLAIDVKYGDVELALINNDNENCRQQFSYVHGSNIQLLNDPTVAKTITKSPGAICFYRKPLTSGERISLLCAPKAHQGTIPGRFYTVLRYTRSKPEDFFRLHPDKFDVTMRRTREPEWVQIEKFEKEDCIGGPIYLDFNGNSLTYTSSIGKINCQTINALPGVNIWLVIELYGVSLKLDRFTKQEAEMDEFISRDRGLEIQHSKSQGFITISSDITASSRVSDDDEGGEPNTGRLRLVHFARSQSDFELDARAQPAEGAVGFTQTEPKSPTNIEDAVYLEKAIQRQFTKLLDSFEIAEFVDYMYEYEMLTTQKVQEISEKEKVNKRGAIKDVLMILSVRPISKKFMVKALEKTKQEYLMQTFFPDDEKE